MATWKFSCEWKPDIPLPPKYSFAQAFNYLNAEGNSFYILENGANYIQCGGSKEMCSVELREYQRDGSFKHFVFCDPTGSDEEVHIPMSEGGVYRRKKHCFHYRTAIKLFDSYFKGEPWPNNLGLEDITFLFT
jgi:hypothetical protein